MGVAPRWMLGLMLALGVSVAPVWGAYSSSAPSAPSGKDRVDEVMGRYNLHPAFEKLGRGVANLLCGWMELPLNIQKRYSTSDTGASFFTGIAYGLFKGIVRTGVGAYETVTFFLPYPEDFAPILPTLEYFQKGTKRQPLLLE